VTTGFIIVLQRPILNGCVTYLYFSIWPSAWEYLLLAIIISFTRNSVATLFLLPRYLHI